MGMCCLAAREWAAQRLQGVGSGTTLHRTTRPHAVQASQCSRLPRLGFLARSCQADADKCDWCDDGFWNDEKKGACVPCGDVLEHCTR